MADDSLEMTMALLGDDVTLSRLRRFDGAERLEGDLPRSPHLTLQDGLLRWSPGSLHSFSQTLDQDTIKSYLRNQGGVSYSEAPNILRLCVYLNQHSALLGPARRACSKGWAARYFVPVDEEFLAQREDSLRALVLEDIAPVLWSEGGWSLELQRQVRETPLLEELSVVLALARGESPHKLPAALTKKGYDGLRLFLSGDLEGALKEWKRRVSGRKGLPDLMGVFARLAALQANDLQAFLDPRFSTPDFPWLNRFCNTLARHLQSPMEGLEFAESTLLSDCGAGLDALFWRLVEPRLPALTAQPPELSHEGLLALPQLLQARPLEETWRMWLESLRRSTQTKVSRPPVERTDGYLSWRLWTNGVMAYYHADQDAPGRAVDIAKLAKDPPDYLSLQDRIVLGKMRGSEMTARAVRSLVGHPHLSFEAGPCHLVERPQKLHLEKTPEGLQLELRPEIEEGKPFLLRRLNQRQVALTVPSPWNQALSPLLKLNQPIPPDGERELREILLGWPGGMPVECGPGVKPLVPKKVRPTHVVLRLRPVAGGLHLEWVAKGGGLTFPALRGPEKEVVRWNDQDCHVERNFEQERRWLDQVWDRCTLMPRVLQLTLSELDPALDLLQQLHGSSVPMEWSEGKKWKLRPSVTAKSLSVATRKAEGDWFELSGFLRVDESKVLSLSRALQLSRDYPGRYLQLGEGDFVLLDQRLRRQLDELGDLLEIGNGPLQLSTLAVPALEDIGIDELQSDGKYASVLRRFQEAQQTRAAVPRTLQAELRDYQEVGFRWLAQRAALRVGACLADDMGLGKTIQALTLMIQEQSEGPHLVVCPTSVAGHWEEQIVRFCPTLEPIRYEGTGRRSLLETVGPSQVVIASYQVLLRDRRHLAPVKWQVALLDEAQMIKNPRSQTARACFELKAEIRLATTGTPIENRLTELWSLFRFLNPGLLGSLDSFRRRFEKTFERDNRPRLRRVVAPFLLRRLKSDVLQELPARTELTLTVDLSADELALYESVRRQAEEELEKGDTMRLLAHLTRLRQACCHPRLLVPESEVASSKITALMELVEHLREGNHRALVFSQFTSLLDLVQTELETAGVDYLRLDGSTPASSRQARVSAFQNGQGDLFLISLKAGGTGLNLTAADYVVHLDPWWNPAAEDQATDRAHRFGQTRPVTVYRILTRNTIEEKVLRLHGYKRELARDVLSGGGRREAPLGIEELRALVMR